MSFDDERKRLVAKFSPAHRYQNFGAALQSIEISGFRGIDDLRIQIKAPIVAFCGLNGTGKSTIAQLACCAYKKPSTAALKRYYVKDFFPVSVADPNPFATAARVVYTYTAERGLDNQQVTVSRAQKEWSGYQRQPERACYYVGFTQFLPKVERKDLSIYRGSLAQLGQSRPLEEDAAKKVSSILGIAYDDLSFTELTYQQRATELAKATAHGVTYSENNMGFGEGRVVYMVRSMEEAPAQSLFVLEEPETSLHGEAQIRLAEYLVDVCKRRGHQVVITTHSTAVIQRLPVESIVYIRRHADTRKLEAFPGLPAYQIDAYLRGVGAKRDHTVCVEDEFAKVLLQEVLRQFEPRLLNGVSIVPVGDKRDVAVAVKVLRSAGVTAVGVTDADAGDSGPDRVRSFPGNQAPEKEVFNNDEVKKFFRREYEVDVSSVILSCMDHHEFPEVVANHVHSSREVVMTEACRQYVAAHGSGYFLKIVEFVKGNLQ
ncbi:hypothetical protein GCM10022247_39310 [Allokutzneria multivorans]|uniref:AAA+ ATPase domain-containing protein n=1 Tax=Allokutzneria multivorans TaxID=1142134 RepID=A0ABP7SKN1_9PSEU